LSPECVPETGRLTYALHSDLSIVRFLTTRFGDGRSLFTELLPVGAKRLRDTVAVDVLFELPTSAWPYGRVALQENGVRAAGDDKLITATRLAAEKILRRCRCRSIYCPAPKMLATDVCDKGGLTSRCS